MITLKRAIGICLGLSALALAVSAYFWPSLPATVATHFDLEGHPNGYSPRWLAAILMPAFMVGMTALFAALPAISPRGYELKGSSGTTLGLLGIAINGFLLFMHFAMLRSAAGHIAFGSGIIGLGLALLFAVIGNRMGTVRRNFFLGIRTPWTLADEEVWYRTHRFGSRVFLVAAALLGIAAFVPHGLVAILPVSLVAGLVPVVYSYVVYQRLHPRIRV